MGFPLGHVVVAPGHRCRFVGVGRLDWNPPGNSSRAGGVVARGLVVLAQMNQAIQIND